MLINEVITIKQVNLIKRMNKICTRKFNILANPYKKKATEYISANYDEFRQRCYNASLIA